MKHITNCLSGVMSAGTNAYGTELLGNGNIQGGHYQY